MTKPSLEDITLNAKQNIYNILSKYIDDVQKYYFDEIMQNKEVEQTIDTKNQSFSMTLYRKNISDEHLDFVKYNMPALHQFMEDFPNLACRVIVSTLQNVLIENDISVPRYKRYFNPKNLMLYCGKLGDTFNSEDMVLTTALDISDGNMEKMNTIKNHNSILTLLLYNTALLHWDMSSYNGEPIEIEIHYPVSFEKILSITEASLKLLGNKYFCDIMREIYFESNRYNHLAHMFSISKWVNSKFILWNGDLPKNYLFEPSVLLEILMVLVLYYDVVLHARLEHTHNTKFEEVMQLLSKTEN